MTEQEWLGNIPTTPTEGVDFGFTLAAKDIHPETLALLTGLHPAHFDPEGQALVQAIIEKKEQG